MQLIRPVFLAFFAFICFTVLPHAAKASLQREGIVAVVNDSVVSYSDMRNRIRLNMTGFRGELTPEIQQQIEKQSLDALINETLQMQEAARLDISITQQQVNEGIDQVAKNNGFDPQEFRARLKATGVPMSTLEDQVRAEIAWSYVVQRKLRPQINISETEIDATFQRIEHQKTRHQYRIAEIVLKGEDDEVLNGSIKEVVGHLQQGAPFPAVAQRYSQSATSGRGGDLGWMDEQQLPAEYRDAVLQLAKGQLAPPLQVDGGVAIVLLIDKYDADTDSTAPAVAPDSAATESAAAGTDSEMRVTLKQIVIPIAEDEPEAVIVAKTARARQLVQEISGCADMAEKSKHFLAPATGDIGTIPLSALPPQIAAMVADLPIGKVSDPIRHRDGIGVLMVCAREGAAAKTAEVTKSAPSPAAQAVASLSEKDEAMRDEVANRLGMERLGRLQEHYLRDLRASAYIELRAQ
ncbi:MAG: hypothetical protein HND56_02315 [Pseudomonadota bacterium]|nr:hypothetical protein [Pseudomonadota bacterium]QKK04590.1 MAG: hypothetical protein HND56_02315 [Pseudomonadota bacterium]